MNKHEIIWRYINIVSKYLMLIAVVTVIVYRCATLNFGITADSLEVSELLAVLLAFFSMGIAIMFYSRSSADSNRFYENSYTFTKETSELLGRIEAGFGERLRHLDEGYSDISKKFDDVIAAREQTRKQVEQEEDDIQQILRDKEEFVASLLAKTNMQEAEKQQALDELRTKDLELQDAQEELQRFRTKLRRLELRTHSRDVTQAFDNEILNVLERLSDHIGIRHFRRARREILSTMIQSKRDQISENDKAKLIASGILREDLSLTEAGRTMIRRYAISPRQIETLRTR